MRQRGEQLDAAVFAANGTVRHRVVRTAVVAGFALLAAWLIALALGVLGGFESLPILPSTHSEGSSQASSQTHAAKPKVAATSAQPRTSVAQTHAQANSQSRRVVIRPPSTGSKPSTPVSKAAPQSTASAATQPSNGHGVGLTKAPKPAGKPAGSPGNASGGSGAPGQLR